MLQTQRKRFITELDIAMGYYRDDFIWIIKIIAIYTEKWDYQLVLYFNFV